MTPPLRALSLAVAIALATSACSTPSTAPETSASTTTPDAAITVGEQRTFPPAPSFPSGPLPEGAAEAIQQAVGPVGAGSFPFHEDVSDLGMIGDVRVAWILADLLRLFSDDAIGTAARQAVNERDRTSPTRSPGAGC